ncbi:MAG: hypothetical protein ABW087_19445 [Candidatus Thiodiazotropha sp.]
MKIQCNRYWVVRSATALPSDHNRGARCSRCIASRPGKGNPSQSKEDKTPEQRHQAMTWAQRLKRVFNIDVSICPKCGGEAKVIACIEDQAVIDKILQH